MTFGGTFARTALRLLDAGRARIALDGATHIGGDVRVLGWMRVINEGELVVGRGAAFVSRPAPIELRVAPGARLIIGDQALLESGATVRARGRIEIGPEARLGAGCVVDDDGPDGHEISIGAGAWIENGVVLLGGSIVAAGSVVGRAPEVDAAEDGRSPFGRSTDSSRDPRTRNVETRVRAVISRVVRGADGIDPGDCFVEVTGWDSLAALRALVALEKEFAIVLPSQLFTKQSSLASVTSTIAARLARREEVRA
ncbi:MAG TPA: phosphopantetheine-binding protein [Polyangiaceae bacterium]|nr:phosphopantetheine-binding protein [Polyangiaceae bacterium]